MKILESAISVKIRFLIYTMKWFHDPRDDSMTILILDIGSDEDAMSTFQMVSNLGNLI